MASYIALVRKAPDTDYSVDFPDFPGCITAGVTLDEAVRMANEALQIHVRGMLEDGDPMPAPSSVEAVMADPENLEDLVLTFLVQVNEPTGKAVRVNVTFDEHLLSKIDDFAKQQGQTRSGFLADAARTVMHMHKG